jgi:membrane protease YdiL (CAAX protease family)
MDANIQPNDWLSNELKPKISYGSQLLILFGLILGGLILAFFVQLGFTLSMMSWQDLMSGDAQKMMSAMAKPENINKARLMQMFSTLVLMFFPALMFAKIVDGKPLDYLGLRNKFNLPQLGLVAAVAVAALFLSGGLSELNKMIPIPHNWEVKFKAMEEAYAEQVMIIGNMKTFADYIISLIMIAILPAFFEEILFRGALQKLLVNFLQNPHVAIIITSFLFSAVHGSYYGFLPRMGLGLLLGYLYYYSKSIWLNITMHFINNGIAITALYWATQKGQSAKDAMDDSYPLWVGGIALIAVVGLMITYKKVCERNNVIND